MTITSKYAILLNEAAEICGDSQHQSRVSMLNSINSNVFHMINGKNLLRYLGSFFY